MKTLKSFNPVDRILFYYFVIISFLILIFNQNLKNWWVFLLAHIGVLCFLQVINQDFFRKYKTIRIFGDLYIIIGFIFLYNEIGYLCLMVFPDYFDQILINLENIIFGIQPSVEFARWAHNTILSELLHMGYVSYFLLIVLLPLILYFTDKKEESRKVLFSITFTFLISYIIFIVFPTAGPRYTIPEVMNAKINSLSFKTVVNFIFSTTPIQAVAAFPSSHVAVAIVILLSSRRYARKVYYVFLPFITLLVFGTVYGGFHYAVDSIAGLFWGIGLFYLSNKVYPYLSKDKELLPVKKILYSLKPLDILIISYLTFVAIVILIFKINLADWYLYIFAHMIFIICLILFNTERLKKNKFITFFHRWYIIPGFVFLYSEIGPLCQIVFQRYFDEIIIKIEGAIFGFQPSILLSQFFDNIVLSEIFHFGYISYFLMIPGLPLILYLKNRREEFTRVLFSMALTFLTCYIIFIFIPVMGPRFALVSEFTTDVKSFISRDIIFFIFARGALKGAAFPSSHVAVAVTILLSAFKYDKTLFKIFLPFVIFLIIGTVYGRFHYAVDSIIGVIAGIILFYLGNIAYIWLKNINTGNNNP